MKKNPSLIILHGWSLDSDKEQKWQTFRDQLTKLGISSQLLKIPGLSAPLQEVWNLDNYAEWLDNQLKGQEDVILLGHSFGGQIAVRYTANHSQKISSLILVDSSGIRNHSLIATAKRTGFKLMAKVGKLFFQSETFRKLLYTVARERDYQNAPPLLRRTMSQILDDEVINDLPKIVCPTLLIWGSDDQVTPLFLGRIFQAKISGAQLQIIDGARHSPQYTHAEEVAIKIHEFVFSQKEEQ